MVEVSYKGRLGNRLFQYSFGRILAEELGYVLKAEPIEVFSGTSDAIAGEMFEEPLVQILDKEIVDLPSMLADMSPRKIWIRAYLQRAEYYAPYRDRVRTWLRLPTAPDRPGDDDLVLSIRLGDFVWLGRVLTPDYYFDIARRHGRGRVWIVTDDPEDPYLEQFAALQPTYFTAEPFEQFNFLRAARHLVLCASTFTWWAAFLSDAEQVYFPILDRPCHWWASSGPSPTDLRVSAPNYTYVNEVPYGKAFTPGCQVDPLL
ncbi:MAG: alpha-1,2-fucosyltransferase [Gemmatimonadaceae bacterium]